MVDDASERRSGGTTVVSNDEAFKPIRPKYKAPDPLGREVTTPKIKRTHTHKSTAERVKQLVKSIP
jgi:hypothetical protein